MWNAYIAPALLVQQARRVVAERQQQMEDLHSEARGTALDSFIDLHSTCVCVCQLRQCVRVKGGESV